MLNVVAREATQDRFSISRALRERGSVFHHLVVLLLDQRPVDRAGQGRLQIRVAVPRLAVGGVKLLPIDGFEPWQKIKAEQVRLEGFILLAVGVARP